MKFLLSIVLTALVAAGMAGADDSIYFRTDENGAIVLTNVPDRSDLRAYPGFGRRRGRLTREVLRDLVASTALRHGVEPDFVEAVIDVESSFDPNAVSKKGAQGLMQLMPATARRFGVIDAFDPAENINGGVRYLRHLLDLFEGDKRLALAAYNAGENAVRAAKGIPPYRETRNYVARVLRRFGKTRTPYTKP